jgi:hypothetical protein
MPFSGPQFDNAFIKFARFIQPRSVLDIGPGNGKYASLVRSVVNQAHIEAIESEESYIERFDLSALYDAITVGQGIDIMTRPGAADAKWNLVVLGDVMEHMPKSQGVDLLHYFVYRSDYIWARWPVGYIQGAWEGIESESHISVWGRGDLDSLRAPYYAMRKGPSEAFIIKGYPLVIDQWYQLGKHMQIDSGYIEVT